ncbi:LysR substrate-binding domain-containing protein [Nocardioides pakistanensis]
MSDEPASPPPDRPLRVGFVAGVTPDKWARRWAERMPPGELDLAPVDDGDQLAVLYDDRADMCFVRLPVDDETMHVIPLYSEVPVVVVPKDHFVEAAEDVTLADLTGEIVHEVPPLTAQEAVETVAAGVGVVVLPMSVARLHNRKDVVHRPVTDAAASRIGLAWRKDLEDPRVETFVGVVRGRTAHSSRGATEPAAKETKQTNQKSTATRRQPKPRPAAKGRPSPRGRRRR